MIKFLAWLVRPIVEEALRQGQVRREAQAPQPKAARRAGGTHRVVAVERHEFRRYRPDEIEIVASCSFIAPGESVTL